MSSPRTLSSLRVEKHRRRGFDDNLHLPLANKVAFDAAIN